MQNKKAFIISSTVLILTLFFSIELHNFLESLKTKKEEIYQNNQQILASVIEIEEDKLKSLAIQLSFSSIVKESLIENNSTIIKKEFNGIWKKLKEEHLISELHFFKPPSISFVNFTNFERFGQDTRESRSDMFWALSSFKSSEHLLVCRTYPGIRATYPILSDDNKILGGVSVGKSIGYIPLIINQKFGKQSVLAYRHQPFAQMRPKFKESFLSDKEITTSYYIDKAKTDIGAAALKNIDYMTGEQSKTIDGKNYFITSYPIYDFHKTIIGYVAIFNDLSDYYSSFYAKEVKNLVLFFIGLFIAYLFLNKKLQNALNILKHLSQVSSRFKNRDFSDVKTFRVGDFENLPSKNEITALENNILEMGCYLRDYYDEMERRVEQQTRELKERYYRDPVTTLRNFNGLVKDVKETKKPALAIIKLVNQSTIKALYGIEAGEHILKKIAKLLERAAAANNITAYKIESNRFAVLSDGIETGDFYNKILKSIIFNIEHLTYYYQESEIEIETDTLVGICDHEEKIIEKAEIALYDAKANNLHYQIYNDSLDYLHIFEKNIELSKIIRHAIEQDKTTMAFQPITDMHGNVIKYEALMRIAHKDDLLLPSAFLEFAKKTRYYPLLTETAIDKTMAVFKDKDIQISINLSARDIKSQEVFYYIINMLKNTPSPQQVWFEITESDEVDNPRLLEDFITTIKEHGAKIAIDDFGSGYSNFSYILKIKPDAIKIDGSIIKKIATEERAYKTAKAIVSFAKSLGIKTVAEFVSSKEILDKAIELGVDEYQGFYFSKPIQYDEMIKILGLDSDQH